MPPLSKSNTQTPSWQELLRTAISEPAELWELLQLPANLLPDAVKAAQKFKLRVPRGFLARMQVGNIHDPLLQQVLPLGAELITHPIFEADPLKEQSSNVLPGLLHKYQSRVLILATSACAIHCRYCFRREFPYEENQLTNARLEAVGHYIAQHPEINEVILSGGDPLVATDTSLLRWLTYFSQLPQLKVIRFHTRLPVVLPERITSELLQVLTSTRLLPVIIIHCNHPQEINTDVAQALLALHENNIMLLNQSVLLRDINDDAEILAKLSWQLFVNKVQPYYLHILDKVSGTVHFDLPRENALHLHQQLRTLLPGYLVPRLVVEEAGKPAKTWL